MPVLHGRRVDDAPVAPDGERLGTRRRDLDVVVGLVVGLVVDGGPQQVGPHLVIDHPVGGQTVVGFEGHDRALHHDGVLPRLPQRAQHGAQTSGTAR